MKRKSVKGTFGVVSVILLAAAFIMGIAIPTAQAGNPTTTPPSINVTKTAAPDENTARTWDLTLNVTGSQSTEPVKVDILLVIDTSGSMDGNKLKNAKAAAKALVNALAGTPGSPNENVDAQFALAYFTNTGQRKSSSYSSDANEVRGWIDSLRAGGNTNIAAGLYAGRTIGGARADAAKYAVLLSDGEPNRFSVSDANTYYKYDGFLFWWDYYALDTGYDKSYSLGSSNVYVKVGSDYRSMSSQGMGDPDYYFARHEADNLKSTHMLYTVGLGISG
ncbi:MAG: VWA domain-containing protein, partial [Clostridiales bacterium]|nr:VWA domain-containing protein [Clostridiales bacterium]